MEALGEEPRPEARPPALTKPDSRVWLWGTSGNLTPGWWASGWSHAGA